MTNNELKIEPWQKKAFDWLDGYPSNENGDYTTIDGLKDILKEQLPSASSEANHLNTTIENLVSDSKDAPSLRTKNARLRRCVENLLGCIDPAEHIESAKEAMRLLRAK